MAEKAAAQIRVVKKGKSHGGHHGGAWKVAYADFVTAMMAFFLVMWIVGLSNEVKQSIAGYFKDPVSFMKEAQAGKMPFGVSGLDTGGVGPKSENDPADRSSLEKTKQVIEKMLSATPAFEQLKQFVDVKLVDEGLEIDLLEARESLFFDSGSANIKASTQQLLAKVSQELGKLPNKVIIEGHTDSRPLSKHANYTNWELSADRANSARRVMEATGLRSKQVDEVRGYAATHPRCPDNPEHFSNRRVSIIVVMKGGQAAPSAKTGVATDTKHEAKKPAIDPGNPIGIKDHFGK
ncbi:MAG: flagellar motor protein MotB [Armatimonadota bacterium]